MDSAKHSAVGAVHDPHKNSEFLHGCHHMVGSAPDWQTGRVRAHQLSLPGSLPCAVRSVMAQVRRLMASRLEPGWRFSTLYLVKDSLGVMLEAAGLAEVGLRVLSGHHLDPLQRSTAACRPPGVSTRHPVMTACGPWTGCAAGVLRAGGHLPGGCRLWGRAVGPRLRCALSFESHDFVASPLLSC